METKKLNRKKCASRRREKLTLSLHDAHIPHVSCVQLNLRAITTRRKTRFATFLRRCRCCYQFHDVNLQFICRMPFCDDFARATERRSFSGVPRRNSTQKFEDALRCLHVDGCVCHKVSSSLNIAASLLLLLSLVALRSSR